MLASNEEEKMKTIEESIEIQVPVSTAYNQWTQFESFPQFMEGVERVDQKEDTRLHWVAEIGGEKREWDAEITEQHPDHRVAWKALDQDGPERRSDIPQARRLPHQGDGADGLRARGDQGVSGKRRRH